jgi:hypothetical protein
MAGPFLVPLAPIDTNHAAKRLTRERAAQWYASNKRRESGFETQVRLSSLTNWSGWKA